LTLKAFFVISKRFLFGQKRKHTAREGHMYDFFLVPGLLELVGALLIVAFTVPESWGEAKQGLKVWKGRSAEKIPVSSYFVDLCTFIATFVYGVALGDPAYIFNGFVTGIAFLYVFIGVWRYTATITTRDRINCGLGALMVVCMFTTMHLNGWPQAFMSSFLLVTVLTDGQRLVELTKGEGTGDVEPITHVIWFWSNASFVFYSYLIDDHVFLWFCIVYVLIQGTILMVYRTKWRAMQDDGEKGLRAFLRHVFRPETEEA